MKLIKATCILTLCSLFLFSCKKERTNWNSDYHIILVNDTLKLNNLSKDSIFSQDTDSSLMLSFEKDLISLNVFDQIQIPDTSIHQKFTISVNQFTAPPGFSIVDQVDDHEFNIENVKLTRARISTGTISVTVENIYATEVKLDLKLPKVTKDGVALIKQILIPAGSITNPTTKKIVLDISGYSIDLTGVSNSVFNKLQTSVKVTTDPNGQSITITNQDYMNFYIAFKDVKLSYAKGSFGQFAMNNSFDQTIDFFNKLSGIIELGDYNFDLILKNSCKVEGEVRVNSLNNINTNTLQNVSLQHELIGQPIFLQSATGNWESLTPYQRTFNFNSNNSNLSDFIANLGSQFKGNIDFKLNPQGDNNTGWNELFKQSRVAVTMKANMPLKIAASDLKFIDTLAFDFNNSPDKTNFNKGIFTLKVENAYPIELLVSIQFLDENDMIIGSVSSPDRIKSSTEGTKTHNGVVYSESSLKLDISPDLASKLTNVKQVIITLKANTISNNPLSPSMVKLPYNGFIGVKLFGDFRVNFKI